MVLIVTFGLSALTFQHNLEFGIWKLISEFGIWIIILEPRGSPILNPDYLVLQIGLKSQ